MQILGDRTGSGPTAGSLWDSSWWRWAVRCGAADCSFRLKVQPAWLAKYRGIQFQQRWYHDANCLEGALLSQLQQLLLPTYTKPPRAHRLPIGLLLVKRGAITPKELQEGLRLQREAGTGKLGYWLRRFTLLTEDQICGALSQQWGCPVFPLERHRVSPLGGKGVPFPLLAAAKAVPVFASLGGRQWYVAFSDHVDHTLLYAIEEILGARTLACVAKESAVEESLEGLSKQSAGNEICFDTVRSPAEMASTICSYAAQLDMRALRLVRAAGFLWAALFRHSTRRDLLFRLPPESSDRSLAPFMFSKECFRFADIRRDGVPGAGEAP